MANPRIDELKKRLEREPGSRLFAQLAEELRKDGDLTEAIRVARAGLAAHPNYPSARMTLGRALFDTGELAAARAELENVLRGAPDNILAARMLAECLEGLGDFGAALLQYRAALRLAPGDRQIESQIRALEQRLVTGAGPARPAAPSPPPPAPPVVRAPVPAPLPPTVRMPAPPVPAIPSVPPLPPGRSAALGSGPIASAAVAEPDADFDDVFESSPSWQRMASQSAAPADDAILLLEDEAPTMPGSPFAQGLTTAPAPPALPPSGARLPGAPPLPAAHAAPPPHAAPPSATPPVPPPPPSHAAPGHVAPPPPPHAAPLKAPPVPPLPPVPTAPPMPVPPLAPPVVAPPSVFAPAAAPPRPPDPGPVSGPPASAFAASPRPAHEDSGATYPLKRPEARGFDSTPSGLGSAPVTMAFDEPPRVDVPPEDSEGAAGLGIDTLAGQPAFGEDPPPDPFAPSPIPEAFETEADARNAKTDPGRMPFADAPPDEPAAPPVAMSYETSSTAAYPVFVPSNASFEAAGTTLPSYRQVERPPIVGDAVAEAEASLPGTLPRSAPITPFGAAAEPASGSAGAEAGGAPSPAETPALSSSTLAELYFEQGFFDRAVEVYEQLLEKEPRNERARARLIEIKARVHEAPLASAVAAPADPHAARRQSLERTIARLERMLAAVRRQ